MIKTILFGIAVLSIANSAAETQTEFITRTSAVISFENRINIEIQGTYNAIKAFGVNGFGYGYACQDIGKAQLAIDLAIHNKMPISKRIDLDQLYTDLDSIQNQICILKK
jgi:hypothetical protein